MSIRRDPDHTRFVVIQNDAVRDIRLSWKARGLLALLLSMPDDWRVTDRWLAEQGPDGRDAVQTGLAELERAGYLWRRRFHRDDGTWAHESVVFESPVDEPWLDNPPTGEPSTEKPAIEEVPIEEVPKNEVPRSSSATAVAVMEPPAATALAHLLADLITANGAKPPRVTDQWVTDMGRLLRLDHRDPTEAETVLRWSQADEFWRGNILSPAKFRAKYDQLNLKRRSGTNGKGNTRESFTSAAAEFLELT